MKMELNRFTEIVKNQCDTLVRVLERHAAETTEKDEMKSYRMMSCGELNGIIETAVCVYATEIGGDDVKYWEKISEIRLYESETESKLTEIYTKWYRKYLENN